MFFRILTHKNLIKENKLNVPVMSLVNIPAKVIENIIGLIITKDYNSAFFAKEINLPIHVADFANILSNILKADG